MLPRCLWSRSRSLLLKIEIQFPLNNFSLLWPIDTKLGVWVANTSRRSLGLLPRCMWSRSRSLFLKKEIQFPLNNFNLLWPIDIKLAAWNQCNRNNGIIFFFTAMFYFLFLSYQHLVESLKTWFRRIAAFLVLIMPLRTTATWEINTHLKHWLNFKITLQNIFLGDSVQTLFRKSYKFLVFN